MKGFDFKSHIQVFEYKGKLLTTDEFLNSSVKDSFFIDVEFNRKFNLWERCNISLKNNRQIKNVFILNGRYFLSLSKWTYEIDVIKDAFEKYIFILNKNIYHKFGFKKSDIKTIIINNEYRKPHFIWQTNRSEEIELLTKEIEDDIIRNDNIETIVLRW